MVAHPIDVPRHRQSQGICRALRPEPVARRGPGLIAAPHKNQTTRKVLMAAGMTFAEAIDVIEETYEFMLAYAAQGRRSEDEEDKGSGIRERLTRAEAALGVIASATVDAIAAGAE